MNTHMIDVRTGQIGPDHDPYGTEEIMVYNRKTNQTATLYRNGLGTNELNLYDPYGNVIRHEKWIDGHWQSNPKRDKALELKSQILFRRHVGLTPDEAMSEFHGYPEDPMGPLSRYI